MLLLGAVRKIDKNFNDAEFEDKVSSMLKNSPNQKGGYRKQVSSTTMPSPLSVILSILLFMCIQISF